MHLELIAVDLTVKELVEVAFKLSMTLSSTLPLSPGVEFSTIIEAKNIDMRGMEVVTRSEGRGDLNKHKHLNPLTGVRAHKL